jgi:hypothetical protein
VSQKSRLVDRLDDAGISLERFIPVRGSGDDPKAPIYREKRLPNAVEQTFGVELGDGLVAVDIDDPAKIDVTLPETFQVRSPHSEEGHRFYLVRESPDGASREWGEFKTEGEYVLGPGSQITSCGKCSRCSNQSPGEYRILNDRPLAELHTDTIQELQGHTKTGSESTQSRTDTDSRGSIELSEGEPSDAGNSLTDRQVLEVGKEAANGDKFCRLWDGDTAEYPSHSEADLAFCNLLAFYTNRDSEQMDRLFRRSELYRPKWDQVHYSNGNTYGEGTIAKAIRDCSDTYSDSADLDILPTQNGDPLPADGERRIVSEYAMAAVLEVLNEGSEQSITQIVDRVDWQQTQVHKALQSLQNRDLIDRVPNPFNPSEYLYYPTNE